MKSVLIVGAFPPPIGGNSVHIERLYTLLNRTNGYSCKVVDLYGKKCSSCQDGGVIRLGGSKIYGFIKTCQILLFSRYSFVHFHVSSMSKFLYVGFLYFFFVHKKSKKILTIHSGSFPKFVSSLNWIQIKILQNLISLFDSVIAVSGEIRSALLSVSVKKEVVYVVHAFLPSITIQDQIIDDIIVTARNQNRKILVASGYATSIYQYETIIEALSLYSLNKDIFLIICLYNEFDESYFSSIMKLLNSVQSYKIFKDLKSEVFSYLLENSDIYVRSSVYDGDCVAIREAYYFRKHVVASDCVVRPEFCVLFETSSSKSLAAALKGILNGEIVDNADINSEKNHYELILSIYGM